nr:MAG TPA: hypothetical protein [Caudoviricetes sp.]
MYRHNMLLYTIEVKTSKRCRNVGHTRHSCGAGPKFVTDAVLHTVSVSS